MLRLITMLNYGIWIVVWRHIIKRLRIGDIGMRGENPLIALDGRMTLRAAVGIESLDAIQTIRADIDANGKINTMDAMMILRRAVGLLDENYKNIY